MYQHEGVYISHIYVYCLLVVFCLTACEANSSENLQETNDTTMYDNMTSESQVEIQNDNNKSDEYTKITSNIENTDYVGENAGMKLYMLAWLEWQLMN